MVDSSRRTRGAQRQHCRSDRGDKGVQRRRKMSQREYELPKHLDRYLAALSKLYAQDGERQLQELVVNAQTRVHEEWTSDNWNGGTYGHALYLLVPESLFLNVVKQKEELQKRLCEDLNKVHNVQNEFIAEVFLE